jgi:iron complex transport system substrate-binding protein
MRVISLLPSATEIVYALGHGKELVGRSSECDFPPEVKALPEVMRPKVRDMDRSSRAIDDRVRGARSRNESLYDLDLEQLRALRPDLLLTQNLCGVCSVTEEEVTTACKRAGVSPRITSLTPTDLAEVWDSFETVGAALGDREAGASLARRARESTPPRPSTGRTIAVVEWLDPPILAGLWTPDLISAAGGVPVGPVRGEPGFGTSWSELAERAPDVLLLSPCSFSVARTKQELAGNPTLLREIHSVRPRAGTFIADEAHFSRPGPRLADGARLLRRILDHEPPTGPMPAELLSAHLVQDER